MAEPPAQNLSYSHQDPPTASCTISPLDQHFANHSNHRPHCDYGIDASSVCASRGGVSYNASRQHSGGDAPSVGESVRSGTDGSVRQDRDRVAKSVNPYQKQQQQRTRRVSFSSASLNGVTSALLRVTHLKKKEIVLSITALGLLVFIGGVINLSSSTDSLAEQDVIQLGDQGMARGLVSDIEIINNQSIPFSSGGIMGSNHANANSKNIQSINFASSAVESSKSKQLPQGNDLDKVPPHLRGYYSKAWGSQPSNNNKQTELNDQVLRKDQFAPQQEAQPGTPQIQTSNTQGWQPDQFDAPLLSPDYSPSPQHAAVDSEEQKRLAAQEEALAKASMAEVNAREKRKVQFAQLKKRIMGTGNADVMVEKDALPLEGGMENVNGVPQMDMNVQGVEQGGMQNINGAPPMEMNTHTAEQGGIQNMNSAPQMEMNMKGREQGGMQNMNSAPQMEINTQAVEQPPALRDMSSRLPPPPKQPEINVWTQSNFQKRVKVKKLTDHNAENELLTNQNSIRLKIANGELDFDDWRAQMKEKIHSKLCIFCTGGF